MTRVFPVPPRTGALIYSLDLVRQFAQLSDRLILFCAAGGYINAAQASQYRDTLGANVDINLRVRQDKSILQYFASGEPKNAAEYQLADNRKALRECLDMAQPSVVVIDHIGASWTLTTFLEWRARSGSSAKLIYATHNFEVDARLSIARQKGALGGLPHYFDALRIWRRDRKLLSIAGFVTAICEGDRRRHLALIPHIDTLVLSPSYAGMRVAERAIEDSTPPHVCLAGSFVWSAKAANLQKFLRACGDRFTRAGVVLDIVGRMPEPLLSRMRAAYPWANITGEVDDLSPYLSRARAGLLIDEAGGGFKLTLLTYAFHRVPIFGVRAALHDPAIEKVGRFSVNYDALIGTVLSGMGDLAALNALQDAAYGFFDAEHGLKSSQRRLAALAERLSQPGRAAG